MYTLKQLYEKYLINYEKVMYPSLSAIAPAPQSVLPPASEEQRAISNSNYF